METFPHWKRLHVHWRTRGNYNQFWDDDPIAGRTRGSQTRKRVRSSDPFLNIADWQRQSLEETDSEWDELESETEHQSPSKKQRPDPIERQPGLVENPDPVVQPTECVLSANVNAADRNQAAPGRMETPTTK